MFKLVKSQRPYLLFYIIYHYAEMMSNEKTLGHEGHLGHAAHPSTVAVSGSFLACSVDITKRSSPHKTAYHNDSSALITTVQCLRNSYDNTQSV